MDTSQDLFVCGELDLVGPFAQFRWDKVESECTVDVHLGRITFLPFANFLSALVWDSRDSR